MLVLGKLKAANEEESKCKKNLLVFKGVADELEKIMKNLKDRLDRLTIDVEEQNRLLKKSNDDYEKTSKEI